MKKAVLLMGISLVFVVLAASLAACSGDTTTTPVTGTTSLPQTTTTSSTVSTTKTSTATATTPASTTASTAITSSTTATPTTSTATLTETEVRAFADAVATSIMEAINEGDYNKYVAPANQAFKDAVSEATFEALCAQVTGQLGAFVSAEYQSWDLTQGYIRVHYKAKFEQATVGLLVVFDQDRLLTGQFFE